MKTLTDSHNIITITPSYVFFNFRGQGCYRVNDFKEEGGEEEMALHGLALLAPYFTQHPDILRAKREVEEQISWIGQGELF